VALRVAAGDAACWTFGAGHRFPAVEAGNRRLVEAGGQHIRGFRRGLDYAFVRALQGSAWTRSVLSGCHGQLDPSARPGRCAVGGSMSLYRAGLRLALFLPLGVAMPPLVRGAVRFHRCELRCQPNLAIWRDPRSNPRPQVLDFRIYVRSYSLFLARRYPRSREDATPADSDS